MVRTVGWIEVGLAMTLIAALTALREWAYARPYASSDERAAAIKPWTDDYTNRPHSGIKGLTPWSRVNNLLGNDT